MALKKIIPSSPNANLLKGEDMTPLKVGDWNNDLKAQIAAELATKADSASPTFTGTVTLSALTDLTPTLEVKTTNFAAEAGVEYIVNKDDGAAITLPDASAGARITILLGAKVTSNTTTITANSGDLLKGYGMLNSHVGGGDAISYFAPDGTDDLIITLNGTTTGGLIGDRIELVGISDTEWRVRAELGHSGTAATPFS
tara:strand:+ start:1877 stop:2473 length:597 start_codon:yes stop_codon:yes gene_type:complete